MSEPWGEEPGPWDEPSWWAPGAGSDVDSDIDVDVDGMDLDDPTVDSGKAKVFYQPQCVGPNDSNPLVTLPNELKLLITAHFKPRELLKLGTACRSLWPFCRDMALEVAIRSPSASPAPAGAQPASLPANNNLRRGRPRFGIYNMALLWNMYNPPSAHAGPANMPPPFPGQLPHGQLLGFNPPPFPPQPQAPLPLFPVPPPQPLFQGFLGWQPPPPPFHFPGNNAIQIRPRTPPDYFERILHTALKYRSTSLLSRVRDCCIRCDKKFLVDKPIKIESDSENESTLLELVVEDHDQEMAEWLLANGAKPDGEPFEFAFPPGVTAENIPPATMEMEKTRQRELWKMRAPLCDLLWNVEIRNGNICVVGLVKLLLSHGAKGVVPSLFLVGLGDCKVHAPKSECRVEMAKAFLSRPDVDNDGAAKERIAGWMKRFMPNKEKRERWG